MNILKILFKITEQFNTFEGAASAVGKLNAQMGTNLDAMALLQEEDPAKQVEMLRDAFTATGKSIENMTKFEKMAAAEAMGMDVDVLQKFLGPKEEISETDKDFDELWRIFTKIGQLQKSDENYKYNYFHQPPPMPLKSASLGCHSPRFKGLKSAQSIARFSCRLSKNMSRISWAYSPSSLRN